MVEVRLTDEQIATLVATPKVVSTKGVGMLPIKHARRGHKEAQRIIDTPVGRFQVRVRENPQNPFDFTAMLLYQLPESNFWFRLRRYNGKSHRHTNVLEGTMIDEQFHIHYATQRYQAEGLKEDGYAEATNRFSDLRGALRCLHADCQIDDPSEQSLKQNSLSQFIT